MEPGPRDRISDLYHRALERAPEGRSAFLEDACAGDAALRREVESLLEYEAVSVRFLETPAVVAAGDRARTPDGSQLIGRQLGPYTIVAPLGAGGMGEVYRARDIKLGREVAIKMLPPHFTADAERRSRFAREARLLATLNHPHIGAIYGLEETDGVTALVLELVEGPTLADRLADGPLPIADALAIARQIAEALDAAHEKGIVHRDLKPANIVLQSAANAAGVPSGDTRAKVLDFGLAKTMAVGLAGGDLAERAPGSLDGTAEGRILGTPTYMSPEQARGQAVDKRTDIWAFGCVLFEMLAGRPAFDGATVSDTFVSILEREPDWAVLPADTPVLIRTLLDRCLRKDPRRRLHDIADAVIEIDDRTPPLATSSNAAAVPAPAVAPRRNRERFAWIVAAAFAVVSCAMVVLYLRVVPPAAGSFEFPIAPPENWVFETGNPKTFEISPDGRQVAAAAYSQGVTMLWVRPIANPRWRQLPWTQGARGPFWSPDSQSLGFFAGGKLKKIGVNGGSPETVADAPESGQGQVFSGAWNREGVILFGEGANSIRKVGPGVGNPAPATTFGKGETAHRWPSFLPDGQHFLYLALGSGTSELRVGALGSPETASLGPADGNAVYASGYLLLVRGGRLMAHPFDTDARRFTGDPLVVAESITGTGPSRPGQFSISAAGVLGFVRDVRPMAQLTWIDRTGNKVGTAGGPGLYLNLDLSYDERRVAVSDLKETFDSVPASRDIWLLDLAGDGPAKRLTTDAAFEYDPAWSPDGSQVAFNSSRIGEKYSLWVRRSDASGEDELLVKSSGNIYAPHWSADGRLLMYSEQGPSASSDLWTLPLSGDRQPKVFLQTPFNEGSAVFSPDGRWVAYESDASGRREIHVCAFPGGKEQIPISRDGGRAPRWRDDGRELFFLGLDGRLMAARIEGAQGFHATLPQPLFQTGITANNNHPYTAARNGQKFLVPVFREVPGSTPITVVVNWEAAALAK